MDSFVCPIVFPHHVGQAMSKDRPPEADEYNVADVAFLVANKTPFLNFPETFLGWAV